MSLWAWWEVVAAHHRVHDYACCHLQADCLESGISSGPLRSITSMGNLFLLLYLFYMQSLTELVSEHTRGSSILVLICYVVQMCICATHRRSQDFAWGALFPQKS